VTATEPHQQRATTGLDRAATFVDSLISVGLCILAALAPAVAARWLSEFVLERLPGGAQIAVFCVWGTLLAVALIAIATEERRTRLFGALIRFGPFTASAYSLGVLFLAILFFSSVTYAMTRSGAVRFTDALMPAAGRVSDFYLWHFLDAIPLVDVTRTLRWDEPLTYTSHRVGWLLLAFKVTVIVPVIAAFTGYWRYASQPARSGAEGDPRRQESPRGAT
jgi:hypothetical protein